MGSQTLEILRQGVWASLTGGWFFDPHQEIFTNTFHFYLWMLLLCLPFSLFLGTSPSQVVWLLYSLIIAVLFAVIKCLNFRLHLMFDGEEVLSEDGKSDRVEQNLGRSDSTSGVNSRTEVSNPGDIHQGLEEEIQLRIIPRPASDANEGDKDSPSSANPADKLATDSQQEHAQQESTAICQEELNAELDDETAMGDTQALDVQKDVELGDSPQHADPICCSCGAEGEIPIIKTEGSEADLMDQNKTTEVMCTDRPDSSQADDQSHVLSESRKDLSNASSELTMLPLPSLESHSASQSAPGLTAMPDSWGLESEPDGLLSAPKSRGSSNISLTSPSPETVVAALDNFDRNRQLRNAELRPTFEETQLSLRRDSEVSASSINPTPPPGKGSERRPSSEVHRPRSISDIVHTPEDDAVQQDDGAAAATAEQDSPSTVDVASLQESGRINNPSTSSQPESIDSSVNIALNKDTASTVAQSGSLGEPDAGSGELPMPRRPSSASGRRRTSLQRRRRERGAVRRRRRTDSGAMADVLLQAVDTAPSAAHVASSHEDTSPGALHCYQDEYGNWHTYMFEGDTAPASSVVQNAAASLPSRLAARNRDWDRETSSSSSTMAAEPSAELEQLRISPARRLSSRTRWQDPFSSSSFPLPRPSSATTAEKFTVPHYFKFQLLPSKFIKIKFDRLALLALLDRNRYALEAVASVFLAVSVSILGYRLLLADFYKDFWIFLFCFVLAGCQFSLIKSVQPDAASPTHGHNHMVAFSRPFYFCALASVVLILDEAARANLTEFTLYGLPLCTQSTLTYTRDFLLGFILGLPLLTLVGLLPQVNTFALYALEQLDMHALGGNAMTTLYGAVYSFLRSIFAVALLFGFCYGALARAGSQGGQHVLFSVFSGLLVVISYHLSRSASDPSVLWALIKSVLGRKTKGRQSDKEEEFVDPLPLKLQTTVAQRLQNDAVCSIFILVFVFAIHVSTVFTALQPYVSYALYGVTAFVGALNHYLWPQLHKPLPWLCVAKPFLRSREHNQFEVRDAAKIMVFERVRVWLTFIERNVLYPAVFLSALTVNAVPLTNKFGPYGGPLVLCITGLKLMRMCFSDSSRQHHVLILTVLFFYCDFSSSSETFLVDYFVVSIFMNRFHELLLKVRFIVTYIAPWQITWGSAFHAFAQPFSVPHSAMLFFQAFISSLFSAPLNPFLGSAIFITSYVRPVKFWEKDYNTNRVDHSNTRLSSQLDRSPGSNDNNLDSIFYEHLTRSLQHSLCGDLMMGRWGAVSTGDCFVLASDYLNALVHIIEVGNGLVTFQLRGLEFRGTYCQQREVEAITEGVEEDEGCCCCEPGHLPNMLSVNAAFGQRWLAWEVSSTKYIVEGYSISDNSAASMLQVFDLRKILVTYYVKSVIFYVICSAKLDHWLHSAVLREALESAQQPEYVDIDQTFYHNIDEDYDLCRGGISRSSFVACYLDWIQYCASRRQQRPDSSSNSFLVTLCFSLCVLARRALGTASHHQSASLESFLFGLHALFKGDFRITSSKDEWVFYDMDLLRKVVAPGVRMSLKLHQDHFTAPEEYDNSSLLYEAISSHETNLVISHEGDPAWRQAVLANTASLLALRHVFDDGTDEYKIIMLNKRYLSFRVIKVNRECVRGLWAGQLQELIFLRNRNPERGSIQNAKQALRNIINSSCDQPIGYPIYVSPLTTSYADTSSQLSSIAGGPLSFAGIGKVFRRIWGRVRARCGASCQQSEVPGDAGEQVTGLGFVSSTREVAMYAAMRRATPYSSFVRNQAGPRTSARSVSGSHAFVAKQPNLSLAPQASAPACDDLTRRVRLTDVNQVYDTINLGRRIDVQWPSEHMRERGGRNDWKAWCPEIGMEGIVVHRWLPGDHVEPAKRSHVDRVILLVQIGDRFVPVAEAGVEEAGVEV